jgi:sec-independent protein translocase protein TatA
MTPVLGVGFAGIGPMELMIVLVIVLILFGAGRLPSVFEQFGKSVRAFRDAQKDESIDVTRTTPPRAELTDDPVSDAREVEREKQRTGTDHKS